MPNRVCWLLPLLVAAVLPAQNGGRKAGKAPDGIKVFSEFPVEEAPPLDVDEATAEAIAGLLALQDADDKQWTYEGVYREDRGNLPLGYRVGGTAITCLGLLAAPGYRADKKRQAAVERAFRFVLDLLEEERMQIGFKGGYDVRGWGHIYALTLFLHFQDQVLVPKESQARVVEKTPWLVEALVDAAIPGMGGWNYSLRAGYKSPRNRASTFMTAPALQALFHAKARGHEVPDQVIEEGLAALERARSAEGGYAYGVPTESRNDLADEDLRFMDRTPGAAARAAVCETTLLLAGRGDEARHAHAVELFFRHWDDLAVRKSRTGTHIKPYGIAPYYFLFGHVYCAQAIERLASDERRASLRQEMRKVLARSRNDTGTWNDRQFPRSAGYGTAMALLALHMQRLPEPEAWRPAEVLKK